MTQALQELDPKYEAWMVSVYYRAEPQDSQKSLPRPAVLPVGRARGAKPADERPGR